MASNITAMAKTYYDCLPVPEEIELMIMWWKYRMEQTDIRYRKLHKSHMEDVNRLYKLIVLLTIGMGKMFMRTTYLKL